LLATLKLHRRAQPGRTAADDQRIGLPDGIGHVINGHYRGRLCLGEAFRESDVR
jgi:hypothetical protein